MNRERYIDNLSESILESEAREKQAKKLLDEIVLVLGERNLKELDTQSLLDFQLQLMRLLFEEQKTRSSFYTSRYLPYEPSGKSVY